MFLSSAGTGVVVGEDANDAEDENLVDAEVPLNNISSEFVLR